MEKRILGKDLSVSAVGLGCMGFSHAYGAPTEKSEAVSAIKYAFEKGYTFLIRQSVTSEQIPTEAFPITKSLWVKRLRLTGTRCR